MQLTLATPFPCIRRQSSGLYIKLFSILMLLTAKQIVMIVRFIEVLPRMQINQRQ